MLDPSIVETYVFEAILAELREKMQHTEHGEPGTQ